MRTHGDQHVSPEAIQRRRRRQSHQYLRAAVAKSAARLPARGAGGEVFPPHVMDAAVIASRWPGCGGKACQAGRRLRGVLTIRVR